MEEKRRTLVGLETLMANLIRRIGSNSKPSWSASSARARHDEEALVFYGNYARAVIRAAGEPRIGLAWRNYRRRVDVAHQEVTEAFQEVRRYEIVWEAGAGACGRRSTRRKEQHTLDEMAMERWCGGAGAGQLRQDRTRGVAAAE